MICVLLSFIALAGCSKSEGPATEGTAATANTGEAPVGRLGNSVVPVRYRIELKIDPTQESFAGNV